MQLTERYRPRTWADVVGQDKVVQRIQALAKRGLGGRAYWISGQSGTGKTTLARLIAGEVAGPLATHESNAQDATLDDVRMMESRFETRALSMPGEPSGRAWILNEAHLLRKPVISRLLTTLEMIPPHVAIVFTVISDGQEVMFDDCVDAHPLLSRYLSLNLSRRDLCEPFAAVAVANCRAAGLLNGKPDAYYVKRAVGFLKSNKNNFRALYQAADAGYLTDADHDEPAA